MATAAAVAVLLASALRTSCAQSTPPQMKEALLAFKAHGNTESPLFEGWDANADPCAPAAPDPASGGCYHGNDCDESGWVGVSCCVDGAASCASDGSSRGPTRLNCASGNEGVHGTLDELTPLTNLQYLSLSGCPRVTGDIAVLASMVSLTSVYLTNLAGVWGDIAALASLDLSGLRLFGTNVHGDVEVIRRLPNIHGTSEYGWGQHRWHADFTTCTFLPCNYPAPCLTDPSDPNGPCGAGCSAQDARRLTDAAARDDFLNRITGDSIIDHWLSDNERYYAPCMGCIDRVTSPVGGVPYRPGLRDSHGHGSDMVAAWLEMCGPDGACNCPLRHFFR